MSLHSWQLRDRNLDLTRPLVMGIVNVTPDSFSDGGKFLEPDAAIAHGMTLVDEGAAILDVGGESTRPGSQPVPLAQELERVLPVVRELARIAGVPISIDTSKPAVARACLEAGATIINDVTALGAAEMVAAARDHRAAVILMHMQGSPATMQNDPQYADVVAEVHGFLARRLNELEQAGMSRSSMAVDPGIGFGKRHAHNLTLLASLDRFRDLDQPICLGVSRKGFIGKIIGKGVAESYAGSVAVACHAMSHDAAQILRVHDVAMTVDAVKMMQAIK